MSSDNDEANVTSCCASCGVAEVDDVKLKDCIQCDLVKYCCNGCQQKHQSKHEEACKRRAAEIRDELLFKQPESSHLGDCPIRMLPLPLTEKYNSSMYQCCSKYICEGCVYANQKLEFEASLAHSCPFCRTPLPIKGKEEGGKLRMKRVEANDPVALREQGTEQYNKGDYRRAFEHWSKAAELGDVRAHLKLSLSYQMGEIVERDGGKEMYHLEEAAIGGHPLARFHLGCNEGNSGNAERAVKHFVIAARQGEGKSIIMLMEFFKGGYVSKDLLEITLRAHQAAVDATKSPQRDAAYRNMPNMRYID